MFRSKTELIAFIDKYFNDSEMIYVPLWYAKSELVAQAQNLIDEAIEADPVAPMYGTDPLTEMELKRWAEAMDDSRDWEWVEETSSNYLVHLLNERAGN